ncbi:Hsp20 family protein [Commensalibacter oyaizuii]|uniref:Hsp20 family protein n=1 Tax=Commensalibacter oyaizuii TaxID=3043873 RepID=A0ABT6PZF3_9PROT|nr:Hsp20 family protein [Commensalibacter sp. TBRC 16381]MDI2090093.1 Hsp20 family protein [Commensalibacter sp. TBRC 16381]
MSGRLFTSPMFLGFDHLEQILERAAKSTSDGYPPYNIEQIGSSSLRITLAVAGFLMDDLQITQEDNQLVIRGRQSEDSQERIFLYRGIAARQFQRAFVLAEGIEVESAWLDNGLLHIDITRPKPEMTVKRIEIAQNYASRKKVNNKASSHKGGLPDLHRSSDRSGLERSIQAITKER